MGAGMELSRHSRNWRSPHPGVERRHLIRGARAGLGASLLLLAAAPLALDGSYSVVDNTLSEAGAQGVDGAWLLRTGVALAAGAVFALTAVDTGPWPRRTRWWLRIYAAALLLLVVFPEAPWDGTGYDGTVAWLHTASAVLGATSFVVGVYTVAVSRPGHRIGARAFDWTVIAAVVVIPQAMLSLPGDGILQRLMVLVGYVWLFVESSRMESSPDATAPQAAGRSTLGA